MPGVYTPKIAKYLLKEIAKSKSLWCIHPVQDLLAMSARYYSDNPEDERINVPGTVTKFNWTYRLPVTLDKLMSDTALIKAISEVAGKHK
jgi:4-alpha-glucanotransferase